MHCTSTAHLSCLAREFLSDAETPHEMIPRGGRCPSCREYVLWGDVIRGCYRRYAGGTAVEPDPDPELQEEAEILESGLSASEHEDEPGPSKSKVRTTAATKKTTAEGKRKARAKSPTPTTPPTKALSKSKRARLAAVQDLFQDPASRPKATLPLSLEANSPPSYSSVQSGATLEPPQAQLAFPFRKAPGRPRKNPAAVVRPAPAARKRTFGTTTATASRADEGEFFDLNAISEDDEDDGVPRAPVRR
jgi:structure-specific endonuclease subunit SLX1